MGGIFFLHQGNGPEELKSNAWEDHAFLKNETYSSVPFLTFLKVPELQSHTQYLKVTSSLPVSQYPGEHFWEAANPDLAQVNGVTVYKQ